ncbi:MAG: CehA/McbA family metallohydrolase [Pirellulaceae bacterium]
MALSLLWNASPNLHAQSVGIVEIDLFEEETEEPQTCRVVIKDEKGRKLRARGGQFESGWNLVESPLVFRGRPGHYTYRVYHGPEFAGGHGDFDLDKRSEGYDVLRLPKHADMDAEGYAAGDLAGFLPSAKLLKWLPAERLVMAVEATTSVGANEAIELAKSPVARLKDKQDSEAWIERHSYIDNRAGSGLALHHWVPPAPVPDSLPSTRLIVMAKSSGEPNSESVDALEPHVEITRLWERDVPVWLASQNVDSIQVLGPHLTMDGTKFDRVRAALDPDPGRFTGERGPGRLVENLYWQVLEAGFRIPPSAGSGFGRKESPLGYNRVYVFSPSFGRPAWWQGLKQGRSFVSNGPLLRVTVNGEVPGHTFHAQEGGEIELSVALKLTVGDPVDYLDVIHNGEKLYEARLDEHAKRGGRIPPLKVTESGWMLVRVVTGRDHTYRLAFTAPYYFEVGEQPRISRKAVEFFQEWLAKSAQRLRAENAVQHETYLRAAEEFWTSRLGAVTAD